jgi:hypothetical protein
MINAIGSQEAAFYPSIDFFLGNLEEFRDFSNAQLHEDDRQLFVGVVR